MPLLDHFHPPLSERRGWQGFHSMWTTEIAATLNQGVLPPDYFADPQIKYGGHVEVDVAMLHEREDTAATTDGNGGVAIQVAVETALMEMPAAFPDEVEVR